MDDVTCLLDGHSDPKPLTIAKALREITAAVRRGAAVRPTLQGVAIIWNAGLHGSAGIDANYTVSPEHTDYEPLVKRLQGLARIVNARTLHDMHVAVAWAGAYDDRRDCLDAVEQLMRFTSSRALRDVHYQALLMSVLAGGDLTLEGVRSYGPTVVIDAAEDHITQLFCGRESDFQELLRAYAKLHAALP